MLVRKWYANLSFQSNDWEKLWSEIEFNFGKIAVTDVNRHVGKVVELHLQEEVENIWMQQIGAECGKHHRIQNSQQQWFLPSELGATRFFQARGYKPVRKLSFETILYCNKMVKNGTYTFHESPVICTSEFYATDSLFRETIEASYCLTNYMVTDVYSKSLWGRQFSINWEIL